jgi:hypothetical protein
MYSGLQWPLVWPGTVPPDGVVTVDLPVAFLAVLGVVDT